jgi:hypothetical protein
MTRLRRDDEARMSNDEGMINDEQRKGRVPLKFGIRVSALIRHSSLDIPSSFAWQRY